MLLQEVHHRVKNNLQVISSMLNLQKSFVKDPETLNLLEESTNRIATMSFIHESLYRNTDFANISFASTCNASAPTSSRAIHEAIARWCSKPCLTRCI